MAADFSVQGQVPAWETHWVTGIPSTVAAWLQEKPQGQSDSSLQVPPQKLPSSP
jgi:hypothetical protein